MPTLEDRLNAVLQAIGLESSPTPDWVREDGTTKGPGFFGLLKRPDGGVMSEFTISTDRVKDPKTGKEIDFPTFVPSLNKDEVQTLLNLKDGEKLPPSIVSKAEAFALKRLKEGKSVFAQPGETDLESYSDLPRAPMPEFTKGKGTQVLDSLEHGAGNVLRGAGVLPPELPSEGVDALKAAVGNWLQKNGTLQRVIKSPAPEAEPLAPPSLGLGGSTTKDIIEGLYEGGVRPLTSMAGIAGFVSGEAGLPKGLSKAQFASWLEKHPEVVERAQRLLTDETGELKLADLFKESTPEATPKHKSFLPPPTKQPVPSDLRFEELLKKLGGRGPNE